MIIKNSFVCKKAKLATLIASVLKVHDGLGVKEGRVGLQTSFLS